MLNSFIQYHTVQNYIKLFKPTTDRIIIIENNAKQWAEKLSRFYIRPATRSIRYYNTADCRSGLRAYCPADVKVC